jgi:hypothetical protein
MSLWLKSHARLDCPAPPAELSDSCYPTLGGGAKGCERLTPFVSYHLNRATTLFANESAQTL